MVRQMQSPKIALYCANAMGLKVAEFVLNEEYPIEFVATCSIDLPDYESRIADVATGKSVPVYRHIDANSEQSVSYLKDHEIDLVLLIWWPAIIKIKAIETVAHGWINMHNSLLPYSRGRHPYYWSVVDQVPFGVTLHYINEGIDSGDILFQKGIDIPVHHRGDQIYARSLEAIYTLFAESYKKITELNFVAKKQDESMSTFHLANELDVHSEIILDKNYKARDLINIIRARSFPHGDSAFFYSEGDRYNIKVTIEKGEV